MRLIKIHRDHQRWLLYIWFIFLLSFLAPLAASAAECDRESGKLCDPIGVTDVAVIVGFFIKTLLPLIGAVVLMLFLIGAITWILSGGNPEKVKKGRDTVVWAVLGAIVIIGSYVALKFIFGALTGSLPGYQTTPTDQSSP